MDPNRKVAMLRQKLEIHKKNQQQRKTGEKSRNKIRKSLEKQPKPQSLVPVL